MTSDSKAPASIPDTLGKVAGAAYGDILSPAAKQTGFALEAVFKMALSPISALDWAFNQSREWLKGEIEKRLANTPAEFVASPPGFIAFPVVLKIAEAFDAPSLRALYAELLLNAMDSRTQSMVHPSFVNVISQLTPEEALLLVSLSDDFKTVHFKDSWSSGTRAMPEPIEDQFGAHCLKLGFSEECNHFMWLENLVRLKLLDIAEESEASLSGADDAGSTPRVVNVRRRELYITDYGISFINACAPASSNA